MKQLALDGHELYCDPLNDSDTVASRDCKATLQIIIMVALTLLVIPYLVIGGGVAHCYNPKTNYCPYFLTGKKESKGIIAITVRHIRSALLRPNVLD